MTLDELWEAASKALEAVPANYSDRGVAFATLVVAGEIRALREHLANPPREVEQLSPDFARTEWGRTFEQAKADADAIRRQDAKDERRQEQSE